MGLVGVAMERRIPKSAVEPLMDCCERLSGETGKPAPEIFREYLELMKRYADYFFSEPWPERAEDREYGFNSGDLEFIEGAESYGEECERFTLVCLRRNISMEGFNAEGFIKDFEHYGGRDCFDCSVREAMRLREDLERREERRRRIEEEMRGGEPSWITREMYEHLQRPHTVRMDKMLLVKLRLYEEQGDAEGRSCRAKNKYQCPYGQESEQLIEDGELLDFIWRHVEWYDYHWNLQPGHRPPDYDMKWYHYDEPGIIEVTSYEDVLKALEDGRLQRVIEERERYMKEKEG